MVSQATSADEAGPSHTSETIPSPTEHFNQYLPMITSALDTLTSAANDLPSTKSDINFHRTMDRKFANDLDEASSRVLHMTEKLLSMVDASQREAKWKGKGKSGVQSVPQPAEKPRRKLEEEEDVIDGYKRGVLGVVDGLLEDSDSCLDDLSGQKKKAAIDIPASKIAAAGNKLPGPYSQGKALGRLPSSILHDKSLAKPQLLFPDTVDNTSTAPWKPTLPTKEHAMVPLDFDVPLEYELTPDEIAEPEKAAARRLREKKSAQHPYYYETRHLPYPTSMFTITEPREPRSFEDTPFTWVDTPEALEAMVGKLQKASEIAVDLEHHSLRTYYGITCLIQISDRNEDWIVDTLALRGELREGKFGGVMTDPAIVKVLHGADSDIHWLQRDFDIYIVNLFDTFHATKVLGFTQHSLAYLLSHYCQFEADKRYQMADWRARPLSDEMMMYARSDTHFLLYVYDRLRNALLEESSRPPSPVDGVDIDMTAQRRNPQEAMRQVLERSGETALRMYEREVYDSETGKGAGWGNSARKHLSQGSINEEIGAVFKAVHQWRDQVAREKDESPAYILPPHLLKILAIRHYSQASQIETVLQVQAPIAATLSKDIFEIINRARKEFKSAQISFSRPTTSTAPSASSAQEVITPVTVTNDDVWADVTLTASAAEITAKPTARSSLFGSTFPKKTAVPAPTSSRSKGKTSGLFGKTISRSKEVSPTYEDVTSRIFRDLVPAKRSVVDDVKPTMPSPVTINDSAKQTVTLAPSSAFDQTAPPVEAKSDLPEPSPPKRPKTEEVVQVKKSSSKSKPSRVEDQVESGDLPSGSTPGSGTRGHKDKSINSKTKKRAEVPDFDYSRAPNLLDNPRSGIKDQGKKKKKERKQPKDFSGADFGPAPKEKSNMRAGNKSAQF